MKSNKKMFILAEGILALAVLAVAAFMLWGSQEKTCKISVILPDADSSQWTSFKYGLEQAAKDQGADMVWVGAEGPLSAEQEIALMEEEIKNGADALLIRPAEEEGMEQGILEAQKHLPVLQVEDSVFGEGENACRSVKPDHYEMGRTLAKEVLADHGTKIRGKKIGILLPAHPSEGAEQRKRGFEEVIREQGADIRWRVSAGEVKESCFQDLSKVDLIVALDDESLVMTGSCAVSNHLRGAQVYGIGNSRESVYYLDTGYVECLVVPDGFEMGYQSMSQIIRCADSFLYSMNDYEVSYRAIRRKELFSEENQEIIYTMSQ